MKNIPKLTLLSTLTIALNFASFDLMASCAGDLRLTVAKRLAEKEGLSSQLLELERFNEFNQGKETALANALKTLRPEVTGDLPLPANIVSFLKSSTSHPMHETASTFIKNYFKKGTIEEWSRDLTQNLVAYTYRSGKQEMIDRLETQGRIEESVMTNVLEQRILDFEFKTAENGKFHEVTQGLSAAEFSKILTKKLPFIDRAFDTASSHGPWIHLWHVDMIIHSLRKSGLDPHKSSEFYEWMGKNESITLENGQSLKSLEFWDPLFDSFSGNFTQPERMNPELMKYFTWRDM